MTGYPMAKRPFYTDPDRERPGYSNSFDLLFRGLELVTGGQRLHRYADYLEALAQRGADPAAYASYLQVFAHGMPPHGGFAIGVDRFVAILAGEDNLREVIAFPKTQSGTDPMTGAPKAVPERVLPLDEMVCLECRHSRGDLVGDAVLLHADAELRAIAQAFRAGDRDVADSAGAIQLRVAMRIGEQREYIRAGCADRHPPSDPACAVVHRGHWRVIHGSILPIRRP